MSTCCAAETNAVELCTWEKTTKAMTTKTMRNWNVNGVVLHQTQLNPVLGDNLVDDDHQD